jgi:hypothetical protein
MSLARSTTPRSLWGSRIALAAVVTLAILVRSRPLLELDRFGLMAYDEAVSFVGARGLTLGYLPYRDFVSLQSPGIVILLAPFSLLGSEGFTWAKVAWIGLAGVNTVLLWRIARSWRRTSCAVVAALLYAVNRPSIGADEFLLIEPLLTLLVLTTVLLYEPQRPTRSAMRCISAGVLLGVALGFKLFAIAPVVAFLATAFVVQRRKADVVRLAIGMTVGVVAVFGPFAVLAGGALPRQVFWAQVGRSLWLGKQLRLLSTFWVANTPPTLFRTWAVIIVIVVVLALVAWGLKSGTFVGVFSALWLLVGTLFIVTTPQFFDHYAELVSPPLALLTASLLTAPLRTVKVGTRRLERGGQALAAALLAAGSVSVVFAPLPNTLHVKSQWAIDTRVAHRTIPRGQCIVSDSPEVALEVPNMVAYSVTGGLGVDPYGAAVITKKRSPVPPPSFASFRRSLLRCPWFGTTTGFPVTWSATRAYPGWTNQMNKWFRAHYKLIANVPGLELWHRDEQG